MPVFPLSRDNTSGLIARWSFDQGTGEDTSGVANQGVLTNAPVCVPGIIGSNGVPGNALRFNGTNNYVISNKLILQPLITLSIWVKINGNPASQGHLCGFANGIGNSTADKNLLVTTGGLVRWYVYTGITVSITGTKSITDNAWHHVVGVADGTNIKIYVDGVEDATTAAGATFLGYAVPNLFVNGSVTGSVAGTYIACDEDDFRVYNRGLSAVEVNTLYNEGLSTPYEYELPMLKGPSIAAPPPSTNNRLLRSVVRSALRSPVYSPIAGKW